MTRFLPALQKQKLRSVAEALSPTLFIMRLLPIVKKRSTVLSSVIVNKMLEDLVKLQGRALELMKQKEVPRREAQKLYADLETNYIYSNDGIYWAKSRTYLEAMAILKLGVLAGSPRDLPETPPETPTL